MEKIDLLVKNALLVPMDKDLSVIKNGYVAVKDGKILETGALAGKYEATKTIDASGKACLPGLINTHTHAAMTLFRGYADDMKLDEWLNSKIFPLESRFVDPEFVKLGVELASAEMILGGTTFFVDMYFFEDDAAETVSRVGMRSMMGNALFSFPSPDDKHNSKKFTLFEDFVSKWKGNEYIYPCVMPHTIYTCAKEILIKANEISKKHSIPIHIHLNETPSENKYSLKNYGKKSMDFLEDIGFLSSRLFAAHCVHMDAHDMDLMKKYDVKVANCPESNMKLASGAAPVSEMLAKGITVAFGTDGAASNNDLDMFSEMSSCAKLAKLRANDPTVCNARQIVKMATIDAARTVGLSDRLGSIEKGKSADMILIDLSKPHLVPLYDIYSHLVYAAASSDVSDVIVGGKMLMENRKLLTIDEKDLLNRARKMGEKIKNG